MFKNKNISNFINSEIVWSSNPFTPEFSQEVNVILSDMAKLNNDISQEERKAIEIRIHNNYLSEKKIFCCEYYHQIFINMNNNMTCEVLVKEIIRIFNRRDLIQPNKYCKSFLHHLFHIEKINQHTLTLFKELLPIIDFDLLKVKNTSSYTCLNYLFSNSSVENNEYILEIFDLILLLVFKRDDLSNHDDINLFILENNFLPIYLTNEVRFNLVKEYVLPLIKHDNLNKIDQLSLKRETFLSSFLSKIDNEYKFEVLKMILPMITLEDLRITDNLKRTSLFNLFDKINSEYKTKTLALILPMVTLEDLCFTDREGNTCFHLLFSNNITEENYEIFKNILSVMTIDYLRTRNKFGKTCLHNFFSNKFDNEYSYKIFKKVYEKLSIKDFRIPDNDNKTYLHVFFKSIDTQYKIKILKKLLSIIESNDLHAITKYNKYSCLHLILQKFQNDYNYEALKILLPNISVYDLINSIKYERNQLCFHILFHNLNDLINLNAIRLLIPKITLDVLKTKSDNGLTPLHILFNSFNEFKYQLLSELFPLLSINDLEIDSDSLGSIFSESESDFYYSGYNNIEENDVGTKPKKTPLHFLFQNITNKYDVEAINLILPLLHAKPEVLTITDIKMDSCLSYLLYPTNEYCREVAILISKEFNCEDLNYWIENGSPN